MKDELVEQLRYALPVSLSTVSRLLVVATDMAFLGHLGTPQLAGAGLGNSVFDIAFTFGSAAAVCTAPLCSQAYGANNLKLVGAWLQLAFFFIVLCSIVTVPLVIFATGPAVQLLGASEEVTRLAEDYNQINSFKLLPLAVFQSTRQYLQAHGNVQPALYVCIFTTALNVPLNYVFIYSLEMGFRGSPLATLATSVLQTVLLFLYMAVVPGKHHQTWAPLADLRKNLSDHRRLKEFLKMSFGMFGSMIDNWVTSAITFMTSAMGTEDVAVQQILYNNWSIMWSLTWGFGSATQTRISQHLGANAPRQAKGSLHVGILTGWLGSLMLAGAYYALVRQVTLAYTSDESVISYSSQLTLLFLANFIALQFSQIFLVVFDACGRPILAGGIALITSLTISLPLSYVFGFTLGMKLQGLWLAGAVGEGIRFFLAGWFVWRLDWEREAYDAQIRQEVDQGQKNEAEGVPCLSSGDEVCHQSVQTHK